MNGIPTSASFQDPERRSPFLYPTDTGKACDPFDGRRIWDLTEFEFCHVRPVFCVTSRTHRSLLFTCLKRIEDGTPAMGLEFTGFDTFTRHPWELYTKAFDSPNLVRLSVEDCTLAADDFEHILDLIVSAANIQSVTFDNVTFPPMHTNARGIARLAEYLGDATAIRKFSLVNTAMKLKEYTTVCEGIARNGSLLHLEILPLRPSRYDLGRCLEKILKGTPPLRYIDMRDMITNHDVVGALVAHPSIRSVCLGCVCPDKYHLWVTTYIGMAIRSGRLEELQMHVPSHLKLNSNAITEMIAKRKCGGSLPPIRLVHKAQFPTMYMVKTYE